MVVFGFSEISSLQRSLCLCVREEVLERARCVERLADIAWCLRHTSNLLVNIRKPALLVGLLNFGAGKHAFTLNGAVLWGSEPNYGAWLGVQVRGVTPAELQNSSADHCPKQLDALTTYCSRREWREGGTLLVNRLG